MHGHIARGDDGHAELVRQGLHQLAVLRILIPVVQGQCDAHPAWCALHQPRRLPRHFLVGAAVLGGEDELAVGQAAQMH